MRAAATALIVLAVGAATHLAAEDAKDITVLLTTPAKPAVYRIGERVEIDAAVSANGPGYCFVESGGGLRDRTLSQSNDEFHVAPVGGAESDSGAVYDPYFDEADFDPSMIWTISKLSSVHRLSDGPRSVQFVLNEWVRIAAPGKYRVSVRSARISRCSLGDEAPPPLTAQSNEIEITILPAYSSWAASELQKIRRILDFSSDDRARDFAIRRLSYLNTQDSTKEMAARFAAGGTESNRGLLTQGLLESSWRNTAISELDRSLRVEKQVPQSIYRVLATLLVAR